jgi:hypothetical protein
MNVSVLTEHNGDPAALVPTRSGRSRLYLIHAAYALSGAWLCSFGTPFTSGMTFSALVRRGPNAEGGGWSCSCGHDGEEGCGHISAAKQFYHRQRQEAAKDAHADEATRAAGQDHDARGGRDLGDVRGDRPGAREACPARH